MISTGSAQATETLAVGGEKGVRASSHAAHARNPSQAESLFIVQRSRPRTLSAVELSTAADVQGRAERELEAYGLSGKRHTPNKMPHPGPKATVRAFVLKIN